MDHGSRWRTPPGTTGVPGPAPGASSTHPLRGEYISKPPTTPTAQRRTTMSHPQIAFAAGRGSDAPFLLLKAARKFEPLNVRLARETYLEALFAARLADGGDPSEVAEAARAAPPPPQPDRRISHVRLGPAVTLRHIARGPAHDSWHHDHERSSASGSSRGKAIRPVMSSSCAGPGPVGRLQGRPATWAGQDVRAVDPLLDRAHHGWQPCDIGVGDADDESPAAPPGPLCGKAGRRRESPRTRALAAPVRAGCPGAPRRRIRNPLVPLPAAVPSPAKAPQIRTAPTAPARARQCAALPAAVAAKLTECSWKQ